RIRTSMRCRPTRRRYVLCRKRAPRMSLSSRSSSSSTMSPTAKSDECECRWDWRRDDRARHHYRRTCLMPGGEEAVAELALLETQQCELRDSSSVLSGCHRRDLTQ